MSAKPSHINALGTPLRLQQYSATDVIQNGRASIRPVSNSNTDFEPLMDSDEAAALLKIHPKTLQRMARRGQVVGIQIGKLWRFRTSDLNKMLEKVAG
jgi:excisionase family DNA binding protein